MSTNTRMTSVRWAFNFTQWNPSHSDMLLASSCIQPEEKDRLTKFVFKKDVKSSLAGLLMMRKFVCEASEMKYDEIRFTRDSKGKPVLLEDWPHDKLNFNVSHHGNYTVLAGEKTGSMLGVDVMKLEYTGGKSLSEFFRLMSKQFSNQEMMTIRGAGNEKEQVSMFCRHWCLKESYVKAIGVGITVNLQDIDFKIKVNELSRGKIVNNTQLYVCGEKLDWYFDEMLLDEEHCVAVAQNKPPVINLNFELIKFNDLIQNSVPLLPNDETFVDNYFVKLDKA